MSQATSSSSAADVPVLAIEQLAARRQALVDQLSRVIIGQHEIIENSLLTLFAGGHALITGVPGLAKTLLIRSLGQVVDLKFNRIQFTPDLMPSDITGTDILEEDPETGRRRQVFLPGPVFANLVLADEINRTPPKTQAAMLETMQERQVTVGGKTYPLPQPFHVFATQNPIEQEGTYPLPEAQLDRFMMKVVIGYPTKEEERLIVRQNLAQEFPKIKEVIHKDTIVKARAAVRDVYMDEKIEKYILDIVFATRFPKENNLRKLENLISYGGSPRASINLALAAKAYAFIKRRGYVIPEDVRAISHDVLRHRIGLTYEAEAENISTDDVINEVLNIVEVP